MPDIHTQTAGHLANLMYDAMKTHLLLFLICICQTVQFANVYSGDKQIVATVGNHTIMLSDFILRYNNFLNSSGTKDSKLVREAILNNMINEVLLFSYDSNDDIFSNKEYSKALEWNRKKVILTHLKEQEIYSNISVTELEMREAFFRANETVSARHLYASTEAEANELYELVKNGVSFELLASQVFTDSVLRNNGGYLGNFTWGDMDPAFEDAAYALNINEISPPVKTAQGYSIIKLESRNQKPLLTEYEFQNKKSHLEKVLKLRKRTPAEKEYISKVFDKNQLSFDETGLNQLVTELYSQQTVETYNTKDYQHKCVSYKDKVFTVGDIEQKIINLPDEHLQKIVSIETLKAAIEGLLINDILYTIALEKGYAIAEPVIKMIDGYKKNIFLEFKIDHITKNSELPDSILLKFYKDNIHSYSKERELNLQEIIVDNENLADSLIKSISNGKDFGTLAKEFSLRRWSAENEGIIGLSPLSKFGNYKEVFWQATEGEILGPLKIENMYGIFRVIGKEDSKPLDYDLVKDEVLNAARFENQTQIVRNYIEKLKNRIEVTVNVELLDSYNILG